MTGFVLLWWVVGMGLVVRDLLRDQFKIEASDLIPIGFLGFAGPLMFLMSLIPKRNE